MSEIDSGGMAFPVTPTDRSGQIGPTEYGLTKREWFAGMALQWIIREGGNDPNDIRYDVDGWGHQASKWAFQFADSMLRAGEGEK